MIQKNKSFVSADFAIARSLTDFLRHGPLTLRKMKEIHDSVKQRKLGPEIARIFRDCNIISITFDMRVGVKTCIVKFYRNKGNLVYPTTIVVPYQGFFLYEIHT